MNTGDHWQPPEKKNPANSATMSTQMSRRSHKKMKSLALNSQDHPSPLLGRHLHIGIRQLKVNTTVLNHGRTKFNCESNTAGQLSTSHQASNSKHWSEISHKHPFTMIQKHMQTYAINSYRGPHIGRSPLYTHLMADYKNSLQWPHSILAEHYLVSSSNPAGH